MLKGKLSKFKWVAHLAILSTILLSGCAEGLFWRAGKYSPWARNQWAEEERIADTLFERKRGMTESVNAVQNAPVEEQQRVAESLAEIMHRDPVLLLRLHSVKLLGSLNCPAAIAALDDASRDHNSDIRVEAIKSWQQFPPQTAIPHLQELVGSDTDIDVRLAATRALASFPGPKSVAAIALALNDPNPALQLRAAESLQQVTGEKLGRDIVAWQNYVQSTPGLNSSGGSGLDPNNPPPPKNFNNVADKDPNSIFR